VLTTLYSFCSAGPPCIDGNQPNGGLLLGSDGNFYGITLYGGPVQGCASFNCGTLFQITPAGALTTITTFLNPQLPIGPLVEDSSGNFYGATNPFDSVSGVLWYYSPGNSYPFTLQSFCRQQFCADGRSPNPPVMGADGNFYVSFQLGGDSVYQGTCLQSGTPVGCGGIERWAGTSGPTPIYSFCMTAGCPDGANPVGQLVVEANGNIYGTTPQGGSNPSCPPVFGTNGGCGTAFEISQTPSTILTTLYNFCSQPNCTDGYLPAGLMQEAAGNFYGTTEGAYASTDSAASCSPLVPAARSSAYRP
jgi:uncharacterized repeat protein (TIGR03803 family)